MASAAKRKRLLTPLNTSWKHSATCANKSTILGLTDVPKVIPASSLSRTRTSLFEEVYRVIYDTPKKQRPQTVDVVLADLKIYLLAQYTQCLSASLDINEKMKHLSFEHCKKELEHICLDILSSLRQENRDIGEDYLRVLLNLCLFKRATVRVRDQTGEIHLEGRLRTCEMQNWVRVGYDIRLEFKSLTGSQQTISIQFPKSQAQYVFKHLIQFCYFV
jgi:hypothetical protein